MKKFSIIALAFVLVFALAACGRRNNDETSAPTTTSPNFGSAIIPDMDPTMDTNIPDPDVDTSMPMYTDGTEGTDDTGANNNTTETSR